MNTSPLPHWIDLAQMRLGAEVVFATDDFFAPKERLILPEEPVFIAGKFDDNGKWMDGWESRRRRGGGYDNCIVRLGVHGTINNIDIDTRHFTGNFPTAASIDACRCRDVIPGTNVSWIQISPQQNLKGDDHNIVAIDSTETFTHVRLNIYPDGGVARLRVYGHIDKDWAAIDPAQMIDLAALENGGRPVAANDEHFGRLENIIAPGRAINMGDGWETRRRRAPGNDWGILKLGAAGTIQKIVIDTSYFKGNFPDACSLQASPDEINQGQDIEAHSLSWPLLLPEQKLSTDQEHIFQSEIIAHEPVRLIRFNIIPDGGIARLRLFGLIKPE